MRSNLKASIWLIVLLIASMGVSAQKVDSLQKTKPRNIDGVMMYPTKDIMDNLSASSDFSTLVNVIKAAELTETFKGTGPITVFAPVNKAFTQLPQGKIDTLLLPAHKVDLVNFLNYYIIPGKITSKDIYQQIKAGNGQAVFKTLAGGTLIASINTNRNIVLTDENGSQSVVSRLDIPQSNGMLFVITAPLLPKVAP